MRERAKDGDTILAGGGGKLAVKGRKRHASGDGEVQIARIVGAEGVRRRQEQDRTVAPDPGIIERQSTHAFHVDEGATTCNPAASLRHRQNVADLEPKQ